MYRKLCENDFSVHSQQPVKNYGILKFAKPNIPLDDIFQSSFKYKDEPSRINGTGEPKRGHRAHTRNYSDFTVPVTRKI